jgi:glycine/D-amino acid oxidase-like deaminating enzyme
MPPRPRTLRIGKSLWTDTHRPHQRYPALRGHCDVDVAIVGGGITGGIAALLFARAGVSVALLEGQLIARGSTGASSALLLKEPDIGLAGLTEKYGARTARRIWALSASAVGEFLRTLRDMDVACDLSSQRSVYYTQSAEGLERLKAELILRRQAGFSDDWLTPGDLRRLTGISGRGGLLTTKNARIDPYKAGLGLVRAAARRGAQVFERTRVSRVAHRKTGVRLHTTRGTIDAARVIVATGYATESFRPLAGRFRMDRTYVLATERIQARERRDLGLGNLMLWDTGRPYHYARWTSDHRLLLGGEDEPVRSRRHRAAALRAGTMRLRAYFEQLLPTLADIRTEYAWEGLFAQTPDTLPFVGTHARYPHHLFALGYGGNGMTFSYLAARMLFEQWQGVSSSDHALFAFGRGR